MSLIVPRGARSDAPQAPPEIREAVEMYAREWGRTGTIEFAIGPNAWMVKLSLKPNDPAMRAWQEGRAPEPPCEVVWLQERNPDEGKVIGWNGTQPVRGGLFRALDIYQMGASGVRTFLDRGNVFSGRGEHMSLESGVRAAFAKDEALREENRERAKTESREAAKDKRRSYLKIPFVGVGINLKGE